MPRKPDDKIEDQEAWERFERAVDRLAKSPPMPRQREGKSSSRLRSRASKQQASRETERGKGEA